MSKQQSTATDIFNNRTTNTEKIKSFSMSNHLIDLLWSEPFYSRILRSLNIIETNEISTAGVLCKDGELNLWWNKEFFASLTNDQVKAVLKHECLHLVYNHTTERKKDPHKVWNYATDLAINSLLTINELPDFCLRPGKALPNISDDDSKNMTQEQIEAYNALSNQIKNFPLNKTSEYYFDELMKENNIEKLEDGDTSGIMIQFDDHDGWDELSQEEKDFFKEKIKDIVKEANNKASSNGWGSVSSELIKHLSDVFSNRVDWKKTLSRFCGFSRRNERTSSIKKINRKYPNVQPGINKSYKPTIAVYIDESGSMTNDVLETIYSELNTLSKRTDFYLYKFDTHVDENSSFLWKKGKKMSINRSLNGGTDFNAPTNHAIKNKNKFDGYLIITDGYAPKPVVSTGIKRGYMIIPNNNLIFEKEINDIVIEMK